MTGAQVEQPPEADGPDPAVRNLALDALHLEAERISGMGSWVWDAAHGTFWSDGLYRILGLEPAQVSASDERFIASVHPDDQPKLRQLTEEAFGGQPAEVEFRVVRPDGEVRHVRSRGIASFNQAGNLVRLMGAVLDLTDRKRLEEHLQQAARLQAVGTLAAGLAHDFNNYLLVVGANLELMSQASARDAEAFLNQARRALDQCTLLTRQLLALARRQPSSPRAISVRELLEHTAALLRPPLGAHIRLEVRAEPGAHRIFADAGQIEQALVNLGIHARDALPQGGEIRFESARVDASAVPQRNGMDSTVVAGAAGWVRLSVTDNGPGIAPTLLSQIFEPYVAGSDIGRRGGLGLASVYALVTQNGGDITVQSQAGRGTRFDLWFPAYEEAEQPPAQATAAAPEALSATTVLVAEDMDSVRAVVVRALQMNGYEVIEAVDGQAALELLEARSTPVDLVLTDVLMPRLGGVELAAAVSERYPTTRLIFMTGCTDEDQIGLETAKVLTKPFRPAQLLDLVRSVLGS